MKETKRTDKNRRYLVKNDIAFGEGHSFNMGSCFMVFHSNNNLKMIKKDLKHKEFKEKIKEFLKDLRDGTIS